MEAFLADPNARAWLLYECPGVPPTSPTGLSVHITPQILTAAHVHALTVSECIGGGRDGTAGRSVVEVRLATRRVPGFLLGTAVEVERSALPATLLRLLPADGAAAPPVAADPCGGASASTVSAATAAEALALPTIGTRRWVATTVGDAPAAASSGAPVAAPLRGGGDASPTVALCEFCWAPIRNGGVTVRLWRWPAGGAPPSIRVVTFSRVGRGQLPTPATICKVAIVSPAAAAAATAANGGSAGGHGGSQTRKRPREALASSGEQPPGLPPPPYRWPTLTTDRLVELTRPPAPTRVPMRLKTLTPRRPPTRTTLALASTADGWATDAATVATALRRALVAGGHPPVDAAALVSDAAATVALTAGLTAAAAPTAAARGAATGGWSTVSGGGRHPRAADHPPAVGRTGMGAARGGRWGGGLPRTRGCRT